MREIYGPLSVLHTETETGLSHSYQTEVRSDDAWNDQSEEVYLPVVSGCVLSKWLVCVVCSDTRSCPTLCGPSGCSPPSSYVSGISQARILEWDASGWILLQRIFPTQGSNPWLAGGFLTTATWEAINRLAICDQTPMSHFMRREGQPDWADHTSPF